VTNLRTFHHEAMNNNLFGGEPSKELTDDLSNDLHVTADTPPTFLWHTAEDEIVPVEQSILFAQALKRAGVPFALHVFPHGHHGLGLGDGSSYIGTSAQVAQWTGLCENWLKSMAF
jgi:dipeptidyl aminopeptidase/acylaminoacyl peptidase